MKIIQLIFLGLVVWSCRSKQQPNDFIFDPKNTKYSIEASLDLLNHEINDGNPSDYVYFLRGRIYFEKGMFEAALSDINSAIGLNSDESSYHFLKSKILSKKLLTKEALQSLQTAESLGENTYELYYHKGNLLMISNLIPASFDAINECISVAPFYAPAYIVRGMLYYHQNDTLKAQKNFESALQLDSTQTLAYYELSFIHMKDEKYHNAKYFINQGLKYDTTNSNLLFRKGEILEMLKAPDSALVCYQKAVKYTSNFANAYFKIGEIYYRNKDFINAEQAFQKTIKYQPLNNQALLLLANCYIANVKYEYAQALLDKLIQSDTANIEIKTSIEKLKFERKKSTFVPAPKVFAADSTL